MKRVPFAGMMAVVGALVALTMTRASGQTTSAGGDVLSALLVEVRGLRAAMEQMASAGPRVQLAMGRLQLQEQRLNTMLRRLDELRQRVADGEAGVAQTTEGVRSLQEMVATAVEPAERSAHEAAARETKTRLDRATADLQRLRAEEAELANSVAAEQARWTDINQRLEELERALIRR